MAKQKLLLDFLSEQKNCLLIELLQSFSELSIQYGYVPYIFLQVNSLLSTKSRTATGMDGTLTLIFRKSETSREIKKSFEHH